MTTRFQKVAVVGAGAVGSFYGAMLARAGQRVVLIGRPPHVEAIQRDGLRLDMAGRVETLRAEASAELAAVQGADLVLFCVKSTDTDTVASELAPLLEPHAVVLSLQNGVENAATIARHVRQTVVPAVVYVATAMDGPGTVKAPRPRRPRHRRVECRCEHDPAVSGVLQDLVALFGAAGVKVTISNDVMLELWSKLMVNCAYNAISALAQAPYARLAAQLDVREIQHAIVREVVALAQAEGIGLATGVVAAGDGTDRDGDARAVLLDRAGHGAQEAIGDRPPERVHRPPWPRAGRGRSHQPDARRAGQARRSRI